MASCPLLFPLEAEGCGLGSLQLDCAGLTTLAVLRIAGQALIFLERAHPGGLDSDHMHEGIIAPEALLLMKATARGVVEKFNCAVRQIEFLF